MRRIKTITIVGGGTAGWMAAAALVRFFSKENYTVQLIESDAIGTVGVGEATVPHLRSFNNMLGIDESEFITATQATYKLGIQFENWGKVGDSYIHPFGSHGYPINRIRFHHYWIKLRHDNKVLPFDQFSMAVIAAEKNKFDYPSENSGSPLSTFTYAFHINAGAYAAYLRSYAESRGLQRIEGKIRSVVQDGDGNIKKAILESGLSVEGDLFIDCSGFRGLLIEDTLKTGYEDWSQWLLCDRAIAMPTELQTKAPLYTRAIAREFGWQWQIPLQHRTGNGYVYSSQFLSDDVAHKTLIENLESKAIGDPNFLRFTPGRRLQSWNKNCVAIGLASGFLEPLESTSIYLIQIAIMKLLEFFPEEINASIKRDEFNRQIKNEYEKVRDFIILHYNITQRNDSELWKYCAHMELPESLERKKTLFYQSAHVETYQHGLFMEPSWLAVYLGQASPPIAYDKRVDSYKDVEPHLRSIENELKKIAEYMPSACMEMYKFGDQKIKQYANANMSLYGGRGLR